MAIVILIMILTGVICSVLLFSERPQAVRRTILVAGLVLTSLEGMLAIFSAYLLTRLEGSIPPTLLQLVKDGFWLPIVMILLVCAGIGWAYLSKKSTQGS